MKVFSWSWKICPGIPNSILRTWLITWSSFRISLGLIYMSAFVSEMNSSLKTLAFCSVIIQLSLILRSFIYTSICSSSHSFLIPHSCLRLCSRYFSSTSGIKLHKYPSFVIGWSFYILSREMALLLSSFAYHRRWGEEQREVLTRFSG